MLFLLTMPHIRVECIVYEEINQQTALPPISESP